MASEILYYFFLIDVYVMWFFKTENADEELKIND